jgi:hypothetical protein
VGECLERRWPSFAGVIFAALMALGVLSCRVGSFPPDALTEPFPDAAMDRGIAEAAGADSSQPCDLLAQNCVDHMLFCYPVDNVAGATQCKPNGSGSVTSACASNLECDGREACVIVPETSGMQMCVTICDPGAITTGCPPKAPCHLIPGYHAGYCVP